MASASAFSTRTEVGTLSLLHGFELSYGGQQVFIPRSSQRLLAFVALHDRPLQRGYVAGNLWTDSSDERAAANLRSALWRLNRDGWPLLEAKGSQLHVAAGLRVDIRDAIARARSVLAGRVSPGDLSLYEIPLDCDLLPDWYDDWVLVERERYRQLRLHALEVLCDSLTKSRRFAEAVEAGLTAVAAEPLRESAQRALITAHLAEGNQGEAIRQYRQFQHHLSVELGVQPSIDLQELMRGYVGEPAP